MSAAYAERVWRKLKPGTKHKSPVWAIVDGPRIVVAPDVNDQPFAEEGVMLDRAQFNLLKQMVDK